MSRHEKTREAVLSGRANANIRFEDLCHLVERLGFTLRMNGGHHIYRKQGLPVFLNLQRGRDGKAIAYQVKQVADIIQDFNL